MNKKKIMVIIPTVSQRKENNGYHTNCIRFIDASRHNISERFKLESFVILVIGVYAGQSRVFVKHDFVLMFEQRIFSTILSNAKIANPIAHTFLKNTLKLGYIFFPNSTLDTVTLENCKQHFS